MYGSGYQTYTKFLPPTLHFFLQILKLEDNSRTKKNCSAFLFQLQNLEEKKYISKWPSEMEILISMHSVFGIGSKRKETRLYLQKRPFYIYINFILFHFQGELNIPRKSFQKIKIVSYLPTLIFFLV